jgi:hypothetical protein
MVLAKAQMHRSMEQNRDPEIGLHMYVQLLAKMNMQFSGGKVTF